MANKTPYNFDLRIERMGKQFRTRVLQSPAGETSGTFKTDPTSIKLEDFFLKATQTKPGTTRRGSPEREAIEQFGATLYNTVFTKEIDSNFRRSWDKARSESRELRIRLRFDVPEFHNIPWEYLYHPDLKQFLALSNDTPIIRYFDLDRGIEPLTVQSPLKILVMISSPEGYPKLDVEKQWAGLNEALGSMIKRNLVKIERLQQPTIDELQKALRENKYHVFHYIGHGKYIENTKEGKLLLEDENGKGKPYSGEDLLTYLHDHETLRLVVLSACEGARTSSEDPYSGVAQTLVQKGIPAVIAMQFEIFEDAAIKFSKTLYESIVENSFPVEAAVSEARKSIALNGNKTEWGIPVLFTRSPDNVLFRRPEDEQPVVTPISESVKTPPVPAPILTTLQKNPKTFYAGIIIIAVLIASIFGISSYNKSKAEAQSATETAIAQATATRMKADSLTATEAALIANLAADQKTSTAVASQTQAAATDIAAAGTATAAEMTKNAPTSTPTITPSPTKINPSITCLDRWNVISDDSSLTTPDTSSNCAFAGYHDLGISLSNNKIFFKPDNFNEQGIFGLATSIPENVTIELQVNITYLTQGEFWIALSNTPRPDQNMMIMAIQPQYGEVRVYVNQDNTYADRAPGNELGSGPPYQFKIRFVTNGSRIETRINSFDFLSQNFNVPQYLFLGFRNKSTVGYLSTDATISNLTITKNK